jgi:hypothetical protein
MSSIIIDLDAEPLTSDGWRVEEHQKGGQFTFSPSAVELYFDADQKNGGSIQGTELYKKLVTVPVMNASLLDWYLTNPHYIPEEWKSQCIFFWGTRYRYRDDVDPYVRCLCWGGDQWHWASGGLDHVWNIYSPALVRASQTYS